MKRYHFLLTLAVWFFLPMAYGEQFSALDLMEMPGLPSDMSVRMHVRSGRRMTLERLTHEMTSNSGNFALSLTAINHHPSTAKEVCQSLELDRKVLGSSQFTDALIDGKIPRIIEDRDGKVTIIFDQRVAKSEKTNAMIDVLKLARGDRVWALCEQFRSVDDLSHTMDFVRELQLAWSSARFILSKLSQPWRRDDILPAPAVPSTGVQ